MFGVNGFKFLEFFFFASEDLNDVHAGDVFLNKGI